MTIHGWGRRSFASPQGVAGLRRVKGRLRRPLRGCALYRSALEMSWWCFRSLPDPAALAQKLVCYRVDALDIKVTTVRS